MKLVENLQWLMHTFRRNGQAPKIREKDIMKGNRDVNVKFSLLFFHPTSPLIN